jgi:hypothetical protein
LGWPKVAGLEPPTISPCATAPPASSLSVANARHVSVTSAACYLPLRATSAYCLEPRALLAQASSPAITLSPSFSNFFSTEPLFYAPSKHWPPSPAPNRQHLALMPFCEQPAGLLANSAAAFTGNPKLGGEVIR